MKPCKFLDNNWLNCTDCPLRFLYYDTVCPEVVSAQAAAEIMDNAADKLGALQRTAERAAFCLKD